MKTKLTQILFGALLFSTVAMLGAAPARADRGRHGRAANWGGGHWIHDRHGGRLGWWWVIGPSWYFYERPHSFVQPQTVIIQQAAPAVPPPVTVVQEAPAPPPVSPVLYYCRATGTHYPETTTCPGGWMTMTAEMPPQPKAGK